MVKGQKGAKTRGYKKKGGTHGSISKAGKTRNINRPFWKRNEEGKRLHHTKKHYHSILANRKKYNRRVTHGKKDSHRRRGF